MRKFLSRPFELLFRVLLVVLPFHALLTVFFQFKIGIAGFGIYKEALLFLLGIALIFEYFRIKKYPKFDYFDYLIWGYIAYLILISIVNHASITSIIYGGRYDFEFLLAFLFAKHGKQFLSEKISFYVKMFLYSGGIAILLGFLVRFLFGEQILIHFGFSSRLSVWEAGWSIPIYHGIEWASIRRFQGIFDGPNQAAFFLLSYLGILIHWFFPKKDWHWLLYFLGVIIFGLIFMTYTRSALLGLIAGGGLVILLSLKTIITKHWRQALIFLGILAMFSGLVYLKYGETVKVIVLRGGSTKGHYERMIIGLNRFKEKPLGQGLAESGPAYRAVHDMTNVKEDFYIPESWYIQQLVEGGFIALLLFLAIMATIAFRLWKKSIFIFGGFIAILAMNGLLHSFETSYAAMLLFMILGLFMEEKRI